MTTVKLKRLDHFDPELPLPKYQTIDAAGADIRACLGQGKDIVLKPGQRMAIPTGLAMEIPPSWEIQVRPRSGLSLKTGLMVCNGPGTIDADYRGEVKIILGNLGLHNEIIEHGDRIAQLVLSPVHQANFEMVNEELSETVRGIGGFGSTGTSWKG